MTITRCARVADVPDDLAEAFRSMPHYSAVEGRDSYETTDRYGTSRWDPLSTEGAHRSSLRLTGYQLVGEHGEHRYYVLRCTVNDTSRTIYVSAHVYRASYGWTSSWHVYDYQPANETTKAGALAHAEKQLAEARAKDAAPLTAADTVGKTIARVETKQTLAEDPYDDKRILTAITLHFTDGTRLTYNEEDGETYHQGDVVETSECERPGCEVWIGRVVSEDNPEGEWVNHSGSTWCENGTGEHVPSEINRQAA
jgi:hypothetical protein